VSTFQNAERHILPVSHRSQVAYLVYLFLQNLEWGVQTAHRRVVSVVLQNALPSRLVKVGLVTKADEVLILRAG